MSTQRIAFIGAGNMASSLIGGLVNGGHPGSDIHVADPDQARLKSHAEHHGVNTYADNSRALAHADVVVLAVKPQVMAEVVRGAADAIAQHKPLVISVAAGVRASDIERWVGAPTAIVRTMPNTPALLGVGATGLFANERVSNEQRASAEQVMAAAGITVWVATEALLDAVTAVSGSGPAYYFLLMEMMVKTGIELGLDSETSKALTLQTALGAARMALEAGDDPATLRRNVTSPGGTTERAIQSFLDGGFEQQVAHALTAACERARELGELLGEQ